MKLNELHDNPGATRKKKRVARGPGSGKGKTAGRGIKGQKSRSGVAINAYEGGQMPLYMRLPKRGFNNSHAKSFAVINLGLLQKFIDAGKIDAKARDHRGRAGRQRPRPAQARRRAAARQGRADRQGDDERSPAPRSRRSRRSRRPAARITLTAPAERREAGGGMRLAAASPAA